MSTQQSTWMNLWDRVFGKTAPASSLATPRQGAVAPTQRLDIPPLNVASGVPTQNAPIARIMPQTVTGQIGAGILAGVLAVALISRATR